jgi:RNA-directed DNA polymerase
VLHIIKMWLKAQVQEKDDRGNVRLSGGKSSTEGTPQGGVISPLLANLYINRLLKVFAISKLGSRLGARIVNYADDFVVLCRKGAPEALEQVRAWVTKMGLQLNETKTCIRDAKSETFKFLGYDFGPLWSPLKGVRYTGATVSKKAMERIREKVSAILYRGRTEPWEEINGELTRMIRGWVNYFHFGSPRAPFEKLDRHIIERARNLLRRRHKEPRDTPRFGTRELHKEYGLVSAVALLRLHASA